jgi:small subunit ribosomal protein S17
MTTQEQVVNRKVRVGVVVSDVNDQTVVVEVERASRHRLYRKVLRKTKKYHVHDPENQATRGDLVRIEECRPVSKLKRFRLVEVLTERAVAEVAPESIGQEIVAEVQRSAARAAAEEADEDTAETPSTQTIELAPAAEVMSAEAPAPAPEAEEPTVAEELAEAATEESTEKVPADEADADSEQKAE